MALEQLTQLAANIDQVLIKDQHWLRVEYNKLKQSLQQGVEDHERLLKWLERYEQSHNQAQTRQASVPNIELASGLPVSERGDEIVKAIQENQVVVLAGETGSGKTTQLPKLCLQAGRGVKGLIGHTQPRRLAARSVAARIAHELGSSEGDLVGYQVRFDDKVSDKTLIKLMTDGILLAETQTDRFLNKYDTIIIDEAHERSLNIDFLLGYLTQLLKKRPDLKVIVTSATIDVERFAKHFNAPVIEVSGRTYPVSTHYLPMDNLEGPGLDGADAIEYAVKTLFDMEKRGETPHKGGDILVFLTGEADIRETHHQLKKANLGHIDILPLYARLSSSEQQKVFNPQGRRRIVLSTNVAETSLTVPGIHYVIDTGLARISRYSYRSKVQRLPIEPISQASANQRAGRCGRIAEGVCLRLYSEDDFNSRPAFTEAEILRTNLASVILQMLHLRLGDVHKFPFIDKPDKRMINDGYTLLRELGAVSKDRLTKIGRQLARLPVDPRLGRMLIAANERGALKETMVITSGLAIQDPRERPQDKQAQSDQKHAVDKDQDSDFVTLLNLWARLNNEMAERSGNQFKKWCKAEFINYLRVREWHDIYRQLKQSVLQLGFKLNQTPPDYQQLHTSLLSGLLSHVAMLDEKRSYKAARNRQCMIFPGSGLGKKTPKWIMAAELVETSQLFARVVAKIEPQWVEPIAEHLIKRQYNEPHWAKKRAQVVALETVTLYGLPIVAGRRVHYGRIKPKEAREIFIRQGLVEGEFESKARVLAENRQLIESIRDLENRQRRRDILVDDETLINFYDERLGDDVVNGIGFHAWLKKVGDEALRLTEEKLMRHSADAVSDYDYPDQLTVGALKLPLEYAFNPGKQDDGVTIKVPIGALRQVPLYRLDWLVPGLLRDKCIALVKSLPKSLRRNFVPAPDMVDKALDRMQPDDIPLTQALGTALRQITGVAIPEDAWETSKLDEHLSLRVSVVDEQGKELKSGRDITELWAQMEQMPTKPVSQVAQVDIERSNIASWDFDELPEAYEYKQAGMTIRAFPALVDQQDSVAIELFDQLSWANQAHEQGVIRLLRLSLPDLEKYVRDHLPKLKQMALYFAPTGTAKVLLEDFINAAFAKHFLADGLPRSQSQFKQLLNAKRGDFVDSAFALAEVVHDILQAHHQVRKQLKGSLNFAVAFMYSDIQAQLDQLIYPGFIRQTPPEWLPHLARFIQACDVRINRASGMNAGEQARVEFLREAFEKYQNRKQRLEAEQRIDPELITYRWLIEELRVSWFAQTLGTSVTISDKRLNAQWEKVSKPTR
ncbi:ATP-dependent RNA helicase HrpA [Salinibius halmophilus]|uniref:ATP-dependent RNA helicase HrpA n=1 Tax=Salinibius halmophilus TaxID=1853216 RepID=UPI000E66497D|nr:ATP-dependent RNA helicase HrpA [Salinibius halmophilus]